jgi:hypothetical protein
MLKTQDLPLLVGRSPAYDKVVSEITSRGDDNDESLFNNLCLLSDYVRVKVWFDKPTYISSNRRRSQEVTEAIIGRFFKGQEGGRGYAVRHERVRHGCHCDFVHRITRYEPVLEGKQVTRHRGFNSLEQFTRKFDPRFITPEEIKSLYDGKSCQHGGKYTPADFHKIGPRGKYVLKEFLTKFKGLNEETPHYRVSPYTQTDGSERKVLDAYYRSWHHAGRDIKIEHTLGVGIIHYASEYHGCGNGRYGLLANEHEFLWLEDD